MLTDSEAAVAREVLIHGPLSRSALATRLHLSPASLTRLTRPLLDAGLLVERDDDGGGPGSVGRPSRPLDLSPTAGTFVGVKLTGERLYLVTTDMRAQVIAAHESALADTSPDAVATTIAGLVEAVSGVRGVGVALGGHVQGGVALDAPFLEWRNVPFAEMLAERLGIPVALENDVVALTDAERWFGVGRGIPGFAVVTIGAGVGLGLVVEGRTVRSPDAAHGTVGHLPLLADGPTCPQGHRGCADALLTTGALTARVSRDLGRTGGADDVFSLARDGEPTARAAIDDAGEALGILCALAANLSLQADIVLAGEATAIVDLARDRVDEALARVRPGGSTPVRVHVDRAGFSAWARGAAAVAIQAEMGRIPQTR
ncbi:ROK family transcriptional regulator [Microbacterium sp. KSW4-17]|uniref:ROK family transcriptional regulator n=1 Tax=Microbacterium galbum TaxID=3075994 RepID=A0ABU3T518_9MICO|nr:ROK family transcriptional regulator [Microbacterium sp. KSW4-17]MDU0366471.1 ROK family transcriptional regulator [Microbacterium sp. KSW4-17]